MSLKWGQWEEDTQSGCCELIMEEMTQEGTGAAPRILLVSPRHPGEQKQAVPRETCRMLQPAILEPGWKSSVTANDL